METENEAQKNQITLMFLILFLVIVLIVSGVMYTTELIKNRSAVKECNEHWSEQIKEKEKEDQAIIGGISWDTII